MKINNYSFLLIIFILFDIYSEIRIILGHFTFYSLYFAFVRHPLAFYMMLTLPYLNKKLNKIKIVN